MRKITLFLIAALVSSASFAQGFLSKENLPKIGDVVKKDVQKSQILLPGLDGTNPSPRKGVRKPAKVNNHRQAPRKAPTMITSKPQGKDTTFVRSGGSFYRSMFGVSMGDQSGVVNAVINGNTIYFQDIVSGYSSGTWVKGTINDADKTISLPLSQVVSYSDDYDYGLQTAICYMTISDQSITNYGYIDDITEASFSIDENGVLTLNETAVQTENGATTYIGLGLIYTDDFSFSANLDYKTVFTPFNIPDAIVPAASLQTSDYSLVYYDSYGDRNGQLIKGGWDADTLWLQGITNVLPESWIKGVKKDNKVTFEKGQFLGLNDGTLLYALGGIATEETVYASDIIFSYDATKDQLTAANDMYLLINRNAETPSPLNYYLAPQITKFVEVAATPATPTILDFDSEFAAYGYDYLQASIQPFDVDGNFINPNKLYYQLYADDEPFTFRAEYMPKVKEDLTVIPYYYTDNYDIGTGGSYLYPYETAIKKYGLKAIYKGGGETRESAIASFENPTFVDANDLVSAETYQSFDGDKSTLDNIGTERAENYDVALYVNDENLKGAKIKSIQFFANPLAKNVSAFKGWVANSLDLTTVDGERVPVTNAQANAVKADIIGSSYKATFDTPYEIKNGVFVGFSFKVAQTADDNDKNPLTLTAEERTDGYFLHTSRTYHNFVKRTDAYGDVSLPILITFEDGSIKEYGARFINAGNYTVGKNNTSVINVAVANNGTQDINSIDYTLSIDGTDYDVKQTFDTPISGAYYGQTSDVQIDLPAIEIADDYPFTLTVNKINGQANQADVKDADGLLTVLSFIPKHRALVEEYTGTWCGWCPRGLIAMQKLADTYGKDFVGVAYHNEDPMEAFLTATIGYPSEVEGFPSAFIERNIEADPYYGVSGENFGINDDILAAQAVIAPADINVTSTPQSNNSQIKVDAKLKFPAAAEAGKYAVEFILIENQMSGTDAGWAQHNYYASRADEYGDHPDLGVLTTWPEDVEGYKFNDVFLTTSGFGGETIKEAVSADQEITKTFTFDIADIINSQGDALVQDINNIEAVALIIDTTTGAVKNAAKSSSVTTGIKTVNDEAQKTSANGAVYNIAGQRVNKSYKGLIIKNGHKYLSRP